MKRLLFGIACLLVTGSGAPLNAQAILPPLELLQNSSYPKSDPYLSPDGRALYFSVDQAPFNIGQDDRPDIWVCRSAGKGKWSIPLNAGSGLNTPFADRIIGSDLAQETFFLLRTDSAGAHLLQTHRSTRSWSAPEVHPARLDTLFSVIHDVQVLPELGVIFVCGLLPDAPASASGDIYILQQTTPLTWSAPQPLPFPVNSEAAEVSVFLAADNESLYFASDRPGGQGGQDLYLARKGENGWLNWSTPVPLGAPINTTADERHISLPISAETACFVSSRTGTSQIYQTTLDPAIAPRPRVLLSGSVRNLQPQTTLHFFPLNELGPIRQPWTASPDRQGNFMVLLPLQQEVGCYASAPGFYSRSFIINPAGKTVEQEDHDPPQVEAALRNNQQYQARERIIQEEQLQLTRLEIQITGIEKQQKDYLRILNTDIQAPINFRSEDLRNNARYNRLEEAYNLLLSESSLQETTGADNGKNPYSGPQSTNAADAPPQERLENLEPFFYGSPAGGLSQTDATSLPDTLIDFERFSRLIERRLQHALLPEVLQELQEQVQIAAITDLKTRLSAEELAVFEAQEDPILNQIQSDFFSSYLAGTERTPPLELARWQEPLARELSAILEPHVRGNLLTGLKQSVRQFIENELRLQIKSYQRANIQRTNHRRVQEQILLEKEIYGLSAQPETPAVTNPDTLDAKADTRIQKDIRLLPLDHPQPVVLEAMVFYPNSDRLLPSGYADLQRIANILRANPGYKINIGTHTNGRCSHFFAFSLTKSRSEMILNLLLQMGVNGNQIGTFAGYGKSLPLFPNDSKANRLNNQRTEVRFAEIRQN